MKYRPLQRTLGSTSLELKCLFLFGVFLVVVITVSFLMYWSVTEEVVERQNPMTGALLVDQVMVVKHWEALESNPDFLPSLRDLTKQLSKEKYDYDNRIIRRPDVPPPNDPAAALKARPRDAFERELLARFLQMPAKDAENADYYNVADRINGQSYEYYQAVRAKQACLLCHPTVESLASVPGFDPAAAGISSYGNVGQLAEGDLMAIVQVSIPTGPTQEAIADFWGWLLAVAIITAFLAMVAFYIVIRYVIVRPLKHLRDVSNEISRGNMALRADIHTGDEFEALAVAFNRMLRHLLAVQEEIRRANASLDAKVDELAQLNMQLYEMNRIKSDFMATMSHELRTPLNSILGFSDVLGSIAALDEKQKRYVEHIQKSGRMLLDMINNILDLAKIESGKMEIRLSTFHIGQVIGAQCDMARPLTEKKNIDLQTEVQPGLPPMQQDQARVQQILNNLLSNAIKFTPEGGRIKVAAQRNERHELVMRVTDTGVGIAEEDQKVIFEKFRQGRTVHPGGDAMTREYPGSGLGLSIVKEICRLLGGEILVESRLGIGSTFTVRLPWELEEQPLLDSPLLAGYEEFAKQREFKPESRRALPELVPPAR